MRTVFIYTLNDPTTKKIRYVGKTKNPRKRLASHIEDLKRTRSHRANWMRSLLNQGISPEMEIVDEVLEVEWPMWEAAYIQFFLEQGCELVNATFGGEGGNGANGGWNKGIKFSKATCLKMSIAKKGTKQSLEHRAAISRALAGIPKSFDHRIALSTAKTGENNPMFGKSRTLEWKLEQSKRMAGKKRGPYKKNI